MFDYEDLIIALGDCRSGDEVEESEEVISAYSLWNLIQNKVSEIHHLLYDNTEVLDRANEMYKTQHTFTGMIDKEAYENLDISTPLFGSLKFGSMKAAVCNKGQSGVVFLFPEGKNNSYKHIAIMKDFHYPEYYGDDANKFLVFGYPAFTDGLWIYLEEIFHELEKLAEIEKKYGYIPTEQVIKTDSLDIKMKYSLTDADKTNISIEFNEKTDPYRSQFKKYVSFDTTIQDDIERFQESILKRIPVKVDSLNSFLKPLVKHNIGDILRGTVKVYEKK